MFSKLFKSTARKRLFKIFLDDSRQESRQHPSKYYLRELSQLLSYSAGSLQRELTGLERDGFVISEKMGNMKFFSLNKKHPFFGELKKYLDQTPQEIEVKVIKKKKPVLSPVLSREKPEPKVSVIHEMPEAQKIPKEGPFHPSPQSSPEEPLRMHID